MSELDDAGPEGLPRGGGGPRGLVPWVCTSNPFYVISAGLFLAGLNASFAAGDGDVQAWALMSGLSGYTLLCAATACLLVRFGNVWNDVRTVMLLAVLMMLATSVTFDEATARDPARGAAFAAVGLAVAVAVSEGMLRGSRLRLPARFRLPYYLLLALFFFSPLALVAVAGPPDMDAPPGEALMWCLYGFGPVAGLAFLTLVPAARRGREYLRANGSPWPWPLYPWTLFGLLALAVPARQYLLSVSMLPFGYANYEASIVGPYFLAPFGLGVAAVLLEIGLAAGNRTAQRVALAAPLGLAAVSLFGHGNESVYRQFLDDFTARLGSPAQVAFLLAAAFSAHAVLRRASGSTEALTAALAALAVVGDDTTAIDRLTVPQPLPILLAAAVQLGVGLTRRDAGRSLAGAAFLVAAAAFALPPGTAPAARAGLAYHLGLAAVLALGAVFPGRFGQVLRWAGAGMLLAAGLAVTFAPPPSLPSGAATAYPVLVSLVAAGYGWLIGNRAALAAGAGVAGGWGLSLVGRAYLWLRQSVVGLDAIVLSLAVFAVAVLVSVGKAGALRRRAAVEEAGPRAG